MVDGYNADIKWTFVGTGGKQKWIDSRTAETSIRKEEKKRARSANSFAALTCDEQVFDEQVFGSTCTSFGDELVVGKELLDCSHQVSHMHDCRNKDEVSSFEQYCDIIAKMKRSYDPMMQIVPRILSDVDFPILNKVAHYVKEGFRRTSADLL